MLNGDTTCWLSRVFSHNHAHGDNRIAALLQKAELSAGVRKQQGVDCDLPRRRRHSFKNVLEDELGTVGLYIGRADGMPYKSKAVLQKHGWNRREVVFVGN